MKANQTGDGKPVDGAKIFPNGYAFNNRIGHYDSSSADWGNQIHKKIAVRYDANASDVEQTELHRPTIDSTTVNYPEM